MNGRSPTRRQLLQMAGASLLVGVSGCLTNEGNTSSNPNQTDGYPPKSDTVPKKMSVDTSSFQTLLTQRESVPLVPIDVAYNWYQRREARFADARGQTSYEKAHITGAVLSPATKGQTRNDPAENWPKSDRIITYCACPHHLSSLRAANLMKQGYSNVYALDEGFLEWMKRNHPVSGSQTGSQPKMQFIVGATDPQYAGEYVWAYHRPSDQREATQIGSDGNYRLQLPFYDVTSTSKIEIEAPDYTITKPLSILTNAKITPGGTLANTTQ